MVITPTRIFAFPVYEVKNNYVLIVAGLMTYFHLLSNSGATITRNYANTETLIHTLTIV